MYFIHVMCFVCATLIFLGNCDRIYDENATTICFDCLRNVEGRSCHLPFCPEYEKSCKNGYNLADATVFESRIEPVLLCHDETSLTIQWIRQTDDLFLVKYSSLGSTKHWLSELSNCSYKTLKNLSPETSYQIEVLSFPPYGEVLKSRSILENTSKHLAHRHPVEELKHTLIFINDFYSANVIWKQGKDLSCFYKIIWYKKGSSLMHRKLHIRSISNANNNSVVMSFSISPLEMGSKYYVEISSENERGTRESPKRMLQINVPSCIWTYKNFSICPPSTPENLTAVKYFTTNDTKLSYKLQLSWNKPKFAPDFYNVTLTSNMSSVNIIISGNMNMAVFEGLEVGLRYHVYLTACSKAGTKSIPATMQIFDDKRKINNTEDAAVDFLKWTWIVLVILILTTLLFGMAFSGKLRNILPKRLRKVDEFNVKFANGNCDREIDESKLLIDKIIGIGAFGVVQKAYCYIDGDQKSVVAVKMLRERPSEEQLRQFYAEMEIMKSVPKHPHVVHLIGVVTKTRPNNPLLLVEYCSNGDLHTFLKKVWLVLENKANQKCCWPTKSDQITTKVTASRINENVLQWKDLLSFARQIAIGMEFLSSLKMIHRDLAARNILVTECNTLKISDFGLSRDIYVNNMYKKITGGKLPFRWMALESLTHQIYTTESDVWSFGIVLWEIVTLGASPYPTLDTEDLIPLLKNGYRMEKPVNCTDELYNLMTKCWNCCPNLRPTFTDLRKAFDSMLEAEVFYVNLMTDFTKRYENIIIHSQSNDFERYLMQVND